MHQNLWSVVSERPNWIVLRYEDLKKCPHKALDALLNTEMCLGVSSQCIEQAVSECDFSNLQARADTASQYGGGKLFRPSGDDPNSRKVRKGKVGGYREELTAEDLAYLEETISEELLGARIFGYEDPPPPKGTEEQGASEQEGMQQE